MRLELKQILPTIGIFLLLLNSASSGLTADKDVATLHQEALTAFQSGQWDQVGQLTHQALSQLKTELKSDWTLQEEVVVEADRSLGNYLILYTRPQGNWSKNQIELRDVKDGKLIKQVRTSGFVPLDLWNPLQQRSDLVYTILRKSPTKMRLIAFQEKTIERPLDLVLKCDMLYFLTASSNQIYLIQKIKDVHYLSAVDLSDHSLNQLRKLEKVVTKEVNRYMPAHLEQPRILEMGEQRLYLEGSQVFNFDVNTGSVSPLADLPFTPSLQDLYQENELLALRGDTLYQVSFKDNIPQICQIQLPYSLSKSKDLQFYARNRYLADLTNDSLVIIALHSPQALVAASFPYIGNKISKSGDLLVNYGELGMRVLNGSEMVYSISGQHIKLAERIIDYFPVDKKEQPDADTLVFYQKIPWSIECYDLKNQRVVWEKPVYSRSTEGYAVNFGNQYIWINGADACKYLLDAKDGSFLSINRFRWGINRPTIVPQHSLFTLRDDWELPMFKVQTLSRDRYLKGNLTGMAALALMQKHDEAKALKMGQRVLKAGWIESTEVLNGLYDFFISQNKAQEARRIAGTAYLKTGETKWKEALAQEGVSLVTPLFVKDHYNLSITPNELVSWTGWSPQDYVYRYQTIDICNIELATSSLTSEPKSIFAAYHLESEKGPIVFSFSREEGSNSVYWTPLLLQSTGDWKPLPPLGETKIAEDWNPARGHNVLWWVPSTTPMGKEGYVLGNFLLWGMNEDQSQEYTIGMDLLNGNPSWMDNTTSDPVKAGDHFYAHSIYGERIANIIKNTQADSLKLKKGDIVLGLGDHRIGNNARLPALKALYPPGETLTLLILRDEDTLRFNIRNAQIGIYTDQCIGLVELNPTTGEHLNVYPLPDGFHYAYTNTEGVLVFQNRGQLWFYEPYRSIDFKVKLKDLQGYWLGITKSRLMNFWKPLATDKIVLYESGNEFIGLDLGTKVKKSQRIIWKKGIGNMHDGCVTDDPQVTTIITKTGEAVHLDVATGEVVGRELLPFDHIDEPVVDKGVMFGYVEGRVVGFKLRFYDRK